MRHLCAAYLYLQVIRIHVLVGIVDQVHLLADAHEILVKPIVHDLVRLGAYLRCIFVHGRLHLEHIVNLPLCLLAPGGILNQIHAFVQLLGDRVDVGLELLFFSSLLQYVLLFLNLLHLTRLDQIFTGLLEELE